MDGLAFVGFGFEAGGAAVPLANSSVVDSCSRTMGLGTEDMVCATDGCCNALLVAFDELDSAMAAAVAVESRRRDPATDIS